MLRGGFATGRAVAVGGLRAGTSGRSWSPANNGIIIEQAQILTTHSLAALVHFGVRPAQPCGQHFDSNGLSANGRRLFGWSTSDHWLIRRRPHSATPS